MTRNTQHQESRHEVERRLSPDIGHRLFRSFIIVALITIGCIMLMVGVGFRAVLRKSVAEEAELDAIRISNLLRDSEIKSFLRTAPDGRQVIRIDSEQMKPLDHRLRAFLAPFDMVKIKIYDHDSRIAYSTDQGIIGLSDADNEELASALKGTPVSSLEAKDMVWDLAEEQRYDIDLVESYVPIFGTHGEILGSFEIYKDVSRDILAAHHLLMRSIGVLLVTLLIVFGSLGALMRYASRTIQQRTRALHESERRYHALAEVSPVGMFRSNVEGDYLYVNERWCEIAGQSMEDSLGSNWSNSIHPNDRERIVNKWYQSAKKSSQFRAEYRFQSSDGHATWVFGQAVAEVNGEGKVTGYVGTITDITDHKKAEDMIRRHSEILEQTVRERTSELASAKEKAEASNRAKSAFLANVSHELRTPLHGILSFAAFGIKKHATAQPDKLYEYFYKINQSGKTLLTLLDDLLDLTKLEFGTMTFKFQKAELGTLIKSVSEEFSTLASERKLTICCLEQGTQVNTDLDLEKIKQVIRNLLSNAVKFSPRGGTIDLCMKPTNRSVTVTVRDEGPGIPEEELEAVFDKFVQSSKTKTGAGGTGLGLSICRQVISAHRGRIWAENNPKQGATFSFELPITTKQPVSEDGTQVELHERSFEESLISKGRDESICIKQNPDRPGGLEESR